MLAGTGVGILGRVLSVSESASAAETDDQYHLKTQPSS